MMSDKNRRKKHMEKENNVKILRNFQSLLFCLVIICQVWKPSAGQDYIKDDSLGKDF